MLRHCFFVSVSVITCGFNSQFEEVIIINLCVVDFVSLLRFHTRYCLCYSVDFSPSIARFEKRMAIGPN